MGDATSGSPVVAETESEKSPLFFIFPLKFSFSSSSVTNIISIMGRLLSRRTGAFFFLLLLLLLKRQKSKKTEKKNKNERAF